MEDRITLILEMTVNEGQLDALKEVVAEMVAKAEAEEGTVGYEWYISEDESTITVHEHYRDSEAAKVHGGNVMPLIPKMISLAKPVRTVAYGNPSDEVRQMFGALGANWNAPLAGFSR